MAAIVTKLGSQILKQHQKQAVPPKKGAARVARVAAKRSKAKPEGTPEGGADGAMDADMFAADDGEVVDKPARADGGTYLSMYFKDMAALDVLRPEEEFTAAQEIEALEIQLWDLVLGYAPALPQILDAIEVILPGRPELKALRKASARELPKLAAKVARKLRTDDADHLFIDAALCAVDRIALGIGVRGADLGSLGGKKPFADWLRKVEVANRNVAEARNDFVRANLRLVVSIARRFNHGRMALSDLIQEGNLGLLKAVERYDYRRGFRFSTYASWWIRHAISRALADKGREVRLPVHMIDAHHRLTKARRMLTGKLGRNPTSEELAEQTNMPLDKVEKMRTWLLESSVSIDKPVGDDEGRVLGEVLEDPEREHLSPTEDLEWEALTSEVKVVLRELRPIEADILRQRFGLESEQELTLKEIGDKYNLSRERIRQLQEQALAKVRRALARRDLL